MSQPHKSRGPLPFSRGLQFPVDTVLLIGPTGVGKTPLGDLIVRNGLLGRRCHHLDFGAELRRAVSQGALSALYTPEELAFIHGVLARGLLLENEHFALAEKIISLFLERASFSQDDLLVLNGMPRHEGQARDLERMAKVHALIVLDCSKENVFCRIRDDVGGDRMERIDDGIDLIGKKLAIFRQRTAPLSEHYEKNGVRIYRLAVTAAMTPQEAYGSISTFAAGDPPITLVTEPPKR